MFKALLFSIKTICTMLMIRKLQRDLYFFPLIQRYISKLIFDFTMVKNLSTSSSLLILLLATLALHAYCSRVPVPTCNSPRTAYMDLPISLQETQTFNMDDLFSGYNLNITIPSKPSFVSIRQKLYTLKNQPQPQPGLRNYHLGGQGNNWGNTLVTISVENATTTVRWGASEGEGALPELTNKAVVQNKTNVNCFDAVWFRAEMILLVDCVQNSTLGLGLTNYFYYVNATSGATLGKVRNDMYVAFTQIWYRKIRLLTQDGYHYLIRAYIAEAVDQIHVHNTYAEILSVNNPMKPWTIRVMDRSFLHQNKLSITDFDVYLGDIYILDYHTGVIKFDISRQQTIIVVGRYRTDSGFMKLGVFSSNLDNEFLLVLAHNHTIIEVDWSNQITPEIVTKYTIPDNSWIHDLWVNEKYVVVQLSANLTNDKGAQVPYQSTYVFTRGSRTYTNAYVAIPHPNRHAFVDLHRENSQILTIDTQKITNYQISTPLVSIMPTSPDLQNKQFNFLVKAESSNEYEVNNTLICTFTFKYIVVAIDSLALWPTGRSLPQNYYANYPGQLFIPLDRYVLGPNITYDIFKQKQAIAPTHFFLQQNSTVISWWDKPPSVLKYTYLKAEQFDSLTDTEIDIYAQDAGNTTYFSRCAVIPYTDQVHCFENTHAPHINFKISNLTVTRFHYYQGRYTHLSAIVYDSLPNQVFIYDVEDDARLLFAPIIFREGYQGKIQSVEFLGHYLVVVLRYVKEIVFFDMIQCIDHNPNPCKQIYRINSTSMTKIGVNYFSPMDVFVSDYHPFVLFVQCLDRVLLLDVTRQGTLLLGQVVSPATKEPGFYKWQMAIAHGELILINPPNVIEEHDLDEIYTSKSIPFNRVYPTYHYVIPDKFQSDFSDSGNLVYITALDKNQKQGQNTVILVYRSGLPAVSAFYDVFNLGLTIDDVILQVTGSFGDYVSVAFQNKLMMFRQYEIPILVFEDVFGDFNFNLTFTNDPEARYYYLTKSSIHTANYPEDIIINNTDLNKTGFLSRQVTQDKTGFYAALDDSSWFNGSVLNYTLQGCKQCNKKLKVINHVQEERVLLGVHDMVDYAFSPEGGYIQQLSSIIKMNHNGTINQFVNLPSVLDGEECLLIEHSWIYDYTISACKNRELTGDEIYLYTTVYTASKPFVNGPYYSSAKHVTSMHIMQELMIIVDVDKNYFNFDRQGGVIIYAMNHDPFEPEIFDELEFIDSTDLSAANDWPGGPCFIANANFAFTNLSNTYRLVITELTNGLFIVDFKWMKGRKSVEILKIQYINLAEELVKIGLPLPNLAFFTAVAINKEYYDPIFNYWQTEVIVATSNFHSFQINLHIDKTGTVVAHDIAKVFYRYGFYENENYIKTFDGYFAIGQRLPTMLKVFPWYSQLVLTVYDTKQKWFFNETTGTKTPFRQYLNGTNIPVAFMLGGYTMDDGVVTFDWNFTFSRNSTNQFHNIGLLGLHSDSAKIWQFRVHEKLIFVSEDGISDNQEGYLLARNDYHNLKVPIKLIVDQVSSSALPGWAIALIVIGSLAVGAGIGFVVYTKFIKGKAPNRESETEKSLLQREGEQDDKDEDDDDEDEDEEDQQEQQQEGEQEEVKVEAEKAQPKAGASTEANESEHRPATNDISINRETISSVGDVQKPVEPDHPQGEPKSE